MPRPPPRDTIQRRAEFGLSTKQEKYKPDISNSRHVHTDMRSQSLILSEQEKIEQQKLLAEKLGMEKPLQEYKLVVNESPNDEVNVINQMTAERYLPVGGNFFWALKRTKEIIILGFHFFSCLRQKTLH